MNYSVIEEILQNYLYLQTGYWPDTFCKWVESDFVFSGVNKPTLQLLNKITVEQKDITTESIPMLFYLTNASTNQIIKGIVREKVFILLD